VKERPLYLPEHNRREGSTDFLMKFQDHVIRNVIYNYSLRNNPEHSSQTRDVSYCISSRFLTTDYNKCAPTSITIATALHMTLMSYRLCQGVLHFQHMLSGYTCKWLNVLWSERENQQDATVRCLFLTISQHVSGTIMPIRLVLLKMSIMMPETSWEIVKNKHLTVASWFSLSLHNLLTMHGHRNLKRFNACPQEKYDLPYADFDYLHSIFTEIYPISHTEFHPHWSRNRGSTDKIH